MKQFKITVKFDNNQYSVTNWRARLDCLDADDDADGYGPTPLDALEDLLWRLEDHPIMDKAFQYV